MHDYKAYAEYQKKLSPRKRRAAWNDPHYSESSRLYDFLTPDGEKHIAEAGQCGCATEIYHGTERASIPEITEMVRNWPVRLCNTAQGHVEEITDGDLDQIALIQIEADRIFRKKGLR